MNNKIYSRRNRLFHVIALVAMPVIAFAGIAKAQVTGKIQQGATLIGAIPLWTENNNVVPVCFETPGYDREKTIVIKAVTKTWERHSGVRFSWEMCFYPQISFNPSVPVIPDTRPMVRIRITPQEKDEKGDYLDAGAGGSSRYGLQALSIGPANNPGMHMALAPDGTADEGRVEYLAVHEFGHLLGFVHEQDGPNHNRAHCAGGTEAGSSSLTEYDPDSVMNYCNKDRNMKGNLTAKDIAGLQNVYGTWEQSIGGVLRVGQFRTQEEIDRMSSEDRRNTLITELAKRTKDSVSYYQSLNNTDLSGAGALLVFLRETRSRTDQEIKTMSANDMRNTVIVEVNRRTGRSVSDVQALSNMYMVRLVLKKSSEQKAPFIAAGQVIIAAPIIPYASVYLGWDAGPASNAEVYVSINTAPEVPAFRTNLGIQADVFRQPKISAVEMKLPRRSGTYRFSLKAGGVTIAVADPVYVVQ